MSRLKCYRRVNYYTECQDSTKKLWNREQSTTTKVLSSLSLVKCLFLLHYLLPEEILTIAAFREILKLIHTFKFCYLTIKRKGMKLLYLIN